VRSVMRYDIISSLTSLAPTGLSAPMMTVCFVTVHPGAGAKFETALATVIRGAAPHLVMRPVSGANEYIMMLPAQNLADLPPNASHIESAMQSAGAYAERVRTETWRYRPELSYVPGS
jgi:hypothetical protein